MDRNVEGLKKVVGRLNGGLVWLFALGAVGLGLVAGHLTAGMGPKVSAGAYFGVFALAGFAGLYLTRAKTGVGVLAFILAAVASAAVFYFVVAAAFSEATTALGSAAGAPAGQLEAAGGAMGSMMGGFVAAIIGLDTLIAGLGGALFGARQRRRFLAAV